jgi:hypothetical protein
LAQRDLKTKIFDGQPKFVEFIEIVKTALIFIGGVSYSFQFRKVSKFFGKSEGKTRIKFK